MPIDPKNTPADTEDGFMSRWSRRKREVVAVEDETTEAPADTLADVTDASEPLDEEALTDEELLEKLELPDPATMKTGDDFSAFMQARVPERLRRRALRTLWLSNPTLANLDEMVDYGEDFTDAATVVENMQTVYEVGKGAAEKWKRHLAALAEEEKAKPENDDAESDADVITELEPDDQIDDIQTGQAESPATADAPPADGIAQNYELSEVSDTPHVNPPRHMRFVFD